MKSYVAGGILLVAALIGCTRGKNDPAEATGSPGGTIEASFPAELDVEVSTASGEIVVEAGGAGSIDVTVVHTYASDEYEPRFSEKGGKVVLEERFQKNNARGEATWTVAVPPGTDVTAESASGRITVTGLASDCTVDTASGEVDARNCSGSVTVNTASGAITADDVSGDLRLDSASGKIRVRNARGAVEAAAASGDVDIRGSVGRLDLRTTSGRIDAVDVNPTDRSTMRSASGDVSVGLAGGAAFDLELSTASGKVVLDYNGGEVKGSFTFTARTDSGRIVCPFDFQSETTFKEGGYSYDRKSFTRGGDDPKISIHTASGTAELRR